MIAKPAAIRQAGEYLLSFGATDGETDIDRGRRRILVGSMWVFLVVILAGIASDLAAGQPVLALGTSILWLLGVAMLFVVRARPHLLSPLVNLLIGVATIEQLIQTRLYGGLIESGLEVVLGLAFVVAAVLATGIKAALWWFAVFVGAVIYSISISGRVEPIYVLADPGPETAIELLITSMIVIGALLYFVRQRDRLQRRSDDLLHNILPESIAARLKAGEPRIADLYESASVLFADVVGFTPMSSGLSPAQLIDVLNSLFSDFDERAAGLGLEKIRTVGDEYMVASGVPLSRPDHAISIADFAIEIRDRVAARRFSGHQIQLRIGINSGPVVAGIIGTHKFSYDLWGDVVNIASRMESQGQAGVIQIGPATYELIKDTFVCRALEPLDVKGKGLMQTYSLLARRRDVGRRSV